MSRKRVRPTPSPSPPPPSPSRGSSSSNFPYTPDVRVLAVAERWEARLAAEAAAALAAEPVADASLGRTSQHSRDQRQ